jgi:hypothetical protein
MSAMYYSGLEPDDPIIAVVKPGVTVAYRLLPEDMPTNPNKIWLGKVVRCEGDIVLVELLEPGFQNLREHITCQQIVGTPFLI